MEQFFCKTKIIAGPGALAALEGFHFQRMFLVCDPYFRQNDRADALLRGAKCPEFHIFNDVVPDPSVRLAAEGAAAVQAFQPDAIVALGGGSAMDTAKAMAYFSGCRATLVAVPTTSGSGSEVTDFAILTHEGVKHPLVDESIRPDVAILDSDLVASLPPSLIADGGYDLVCHAVEAFVATKASTISDLLALQALTTGLQKLPASYGGDAGVRSEVHLAATMAGMAFSQAGLGLCHAIAHSLGGELHLPHGRLNAILLPAVMEANATDGCRRYADLARRLGLSTGSDLVAFRALKNGLLRLRRNLQLPETLAQAGIDPALVRQKLDSLVRAALEDPCCHTNPAKPTEEMVRRIITEVMGRG